MAWDGIERRKNAGSYNGDFLKGLDRRRHVERMPEDPAWLKNERMLEQMRMLRRERFEYWDASEYLE